VTQIKYYAKNPSKYKNVHEKWTFRTADNLVERVEPICLKPGDRLRIRFISDIPGIDRQPAIKHNLGMTHVFGPWTKKEASTKIVKLAKGGIFSHAAVIEINRIFKILEDTYGL
jgi:hypothetical protein